MTKSPETPLILRHENVGGLTHELPLNRRVISILRPHIPESSVRPDRADIEILIWKPGPAEHTKSETQHVGTKVQYVIMSGFATSAVDIHPLITALTKDADTIVGIAHPDAPQSQITPRTSPFNEFGSFANSGFAILRVIEKLRSHDVLDPNHPTTVIGFSTGVPVLLEAVSRDIEEARMTKRPRYIQNLALLAPAGILEIGNYQVIKKLAVKSMAPYSKEFIETYLKGKRPLRMMIDFLSDFHPIAWIRDVWKNGKRFFENLRSLHNWDLSDPTIRSVIVPHILFELGEFLARSTPGKTMKEALAHYHAIWPDQVGSTHILPITPAVRRARENIGHDVTRHARSSLTDTPTLVWLGENDVSVPPEKFLTESDYAELVSPPSRPSPEQAKWEMVIKRVKERFPHNATNMHIVIGSGASRHHLTPKTKGEYIATLISDTFYPQSSETVYYGTSA